MTGLSPSVRWLQGVLSRWFHRMYLSRYFKLRPGGRPEMASSRPIVAAAGLSENIAELQQSLLRQAEALLP
jgi:hypothetical protein